MITRPLMPRTTKRSVFNWGLIFAVFLTSLLDLHAQKDQRSNSFLEAGAFFVDAFAAGQGGQSSAFTIRDDEEGALISGRSFENFFDASQWNSSLPIYVQYTKLISAQDPRSAAVGLRLALSRIDTYGPQKINAVTLSLIQLRYSKPLLRFGNFDLQAEFGLGFSGVEQSSSTIASAGLAAGVSLSKAWRLKLGTEFATGLSQNFFDFLTHSAGINYRLKPAKTGQTIEDAYADRDLDGVSDQNDRCPDDFGYGANMGCPDSDNDGVVDRDDACPLISGDPENNGCPIDDADSDGIADQNDQCPTLSGSAANNGCPEQLIAEITVDFNQSAKRLPFSKGDGDFKGPVDRQLEAVIRSMKKNRLEHYLILGFTDASGPSELNQRLSEQRAKAFYDYLVSRGIEADRLRYEGRGELPADPSLDTLEPHPHRRVEIHLIPKE